MAFTAKPIGSGGRVSDVWWTDLTAQAHIAGPVRLPLRLWASNDPLWSFFESDLGLVFSRPDSLFIAHPWCP
jgi:hypothetical protein